MLTYFIAFGKMERARCDGYSHSIVPLDTSWK